MLAVLAAIGASSKEWKAKEGTKQIYD